MKPLKICNLYAGPGGNRKLWSNDHKITAVENNPQIAAIYQDFYPNDKVIVGDAHQYLLEHYAEFDFIWSSPPCPTHSQMRQNLAVRFRSTLAAYPDMRLYQEIILLQYNFNGLWVVENVNPYYSPLIQPTCELQRHLFWTNFNIASRKFPTDALRNAQILDLEKHNKINLQKYKIPNKRQVLRNCVYPPIGLYILSQAYQKETLENVLSMQLSLM